MSNKSQLFLLQEGLKKKKKRAPVPVKENKKDSPAVSMGYYDDLSPILLSGGFAYYFNQQSMPESESMEATITEDAFFAVVEDRENSSGEKGEDTPVITFQSNDQGDFQEMPYQQVEEMIPHSGGKTETGSSPFTLSDADIAGDLSAILSTPSQDNIVPAKTSGQDDFFNTLLEKNREQSAAAPAEEPASSPTDDSNKNIFDAIAKSLNYANSFDLGDYELEQRFDLFDEEENTKAAKKEDTVVVIPSEEKPATAQSAYIDATEELSTKYFVEDLDIIQETARSLNVTVDRTTKTWPAAPAGLVQPSMHRTKELFGEFEYEDVAGSDSCEIKIKGTWAATNIEEIDIPQLKGKINGTTKKEITHGMIRFNKKAKKQLQRLWKAWEDAGLLDRILTYDGGWVPRHIKKKGGGCAISLSNHAWGSAFDINAEWNGLGAEPALFGQKGCVRELVELANQHGFYWGGHFGTKDGMHFEVAKIMEYTD